MKRIELGFTRARMGAALAATTLPALTFALAMALTTSSAGIAAAQPAAMDEAGCCCVTIKGGAIGCGMKTQAECLAEQPKTPLYDKLPDWAQAVEKSEAAESVKMKTGWHAGKCPS